MYCPEISKWKKTIRPKAENMNLIQKIFIQNQNRYMYLLTFDGKTVSVLSTYDSVSNKRGSSF